MTHTPSVVSDQRRAIVAGVFQAIDAKDVSALVGFFAPDATQRFGNSEPLRGHEQIRDGNLAFLSSIASLRHDILSLWESDEGVAIRLDVTYVTLDGRTVTIPVATTFCERGGLIEQYQVYFDAAPVFNGDL